MHQVDFQGVTDSSRSGSLFPHPRGAKPSIPKLSIPRLRRPDQDCAQRGLVLPRSRPSAELSSRPPPVPSFESPIPSPQSAFRGSVTNRPSTFQPPVTTNVSPIVIAFALGRRGGGVETIELGTGFVSPRNRRKTRKEALSVAIGTETGAHLCAPGSLPRWSSTHPRVALTVSTSGDSARAWRHAAYRNPRTTCPL